MPAPARDPAELERLVKGYRLSQCIVAVADVGVADLLRDGPLDAATLARAARCQPDTLYRVMRYLASEGIFAVDSAGRFALTPISRRLTRDAPDSARTMLLGWLGLPLAYRAYGELVGALRGRGRPFELAFGTHFHDYLAAHPEEARAYNDANAETVEAFEAAASAYDFSRAATVVDVGGGLGLFLVALLRRHPRMRGILYDLPHVTEAARARLASEPEAERITVVAGDAFKAIPPGGDAYVFTTVLRCFDDAAALRIMRNTRRAMRPDGHLLASEMVVEEGHDAPTSRADVDSLVVYGGRDRTPEEWGRLCHAAGLRLAGVTASSGPYSWVDAVPAGR